MNIFSKRETLTQNITYMAIMSAINIIFSVIASFLPIFSIILILILPLTSTLVTIYCKNKYYIIYAIASIGLSLVATIYNTEYTILYLIPSILTGFCFGMMIKYNVAPVWFLFVSSLIQSGCTFASIPLINFLFSTDIILFFETALSLQEAPYIDVIVPTFIFFISMAQMLLSYIIISGEISKFNKEFNNKKISTFFNSIYCLSFLILCFIFSFFYSPLAYFFLACSIYFCSFILIGIIIKKYNILLIVNGVLLIVGILIFGLCYTKLSNPLGLLLVGIFPLFISISSLINSILKKERLKDRIIDKEQNK